MGLLDRLKGPDQLAQIGNDYDLTSVSGFKEAAFSCRESDERKDLSELALKVGDRLSCVGKCDAGYPQFKIGDTVINTGWRAKAAPSTYGLQHAKQ